MAIELDRAARGVWEVAFLYPGVHAVWADRLSGAGVVIGATVEVCADVTIQQGVTLGGTGKRRIARHPDIGDRVTIGAGAKVLGPVTVGHGSRLGANVVPLTSVDLNSVVAAPRAG